jgi:hypothetical protein
MWLCSVGQVKRQFTHIIGCCLDKLWVLSSVWRWGLTNRVNEVSYFLESAFFVNLGDPEPTSLRGTHGTY